MNNSATHQSPSSVRQAIEVAVNLGLIFVVVAWCLQILAPFISIIVWAAVIAIAVYKPFLSLENALGGRRKLAVTLIAVIGLGLVIVPAWMFAGSLIDSGTHASENLANGTLKIPPPSPSVQGWPVIGEQLYTAWAAAASDLEDFLSKHSTEVRHVLGVVLSKAAGAGIGVLQFIFSILIAALFLARGEKVKVAMQRFCRRVAGKRGDEMLDLAVATIRSVTNGVLGIAAIQALLGGAGMFVVGVPAAGLWALLILILVIAQLPALLVLGPVIVYVFSVESTTVALIFMVWSVVVSMSDLVLKPLMLGKGVEAPMLVILLGAIGGMIMSGIIGLFIGAVVLALGYKLFQAWLEAGESSPGEKPQAEEDASA